jgi:hypothetical protein
MLKRLGKPKAFMLTFVFISFALRGLTGAPHAEINFVGLIFDQAAANEIAQAPLFTQTSKKTISDHKGASKAPAKSAEYKLYKKYIQPDKVFSITQEFQGVKNQIFESFKSTSFYIKDLTLRSLHSNSPPTPFSPLVFTVFMCLVIIRIGVLGNYGEIKNSCNRRFSLH